MLSRIMWFTHYPERKLEWTLAIYTLFFGLFLILPAMSMNTRSFTAALAFMPEPAWGAAYIVVGIIHNIALHINGRAAWTPFARLLALFLNSQVFLGLALGVGTSNPWSTAVFTYGFFAAGFCGAAIFTAAVDCGREFKIWQARHDTTR